MYGKDEVKNDIDSIPHYFVKRHGPIQNVSKGTHLQKGNKKFTDYTTAVVLTFSHDCGSIIMSWQNRVVF